MQNVWILVAQSQAGPQGRGQSGKKKVYEVRVEGTKVYFAWGMAEKVERQRKVVECGSYQSALYKARVKVAEKTFERGYKLVLAA
jgi:hypothetical protein